MFPAERDAFSDLEDALATAVQLHVERAKSLVKKDRAAAAKEVKRQDKAGRRRFDLMWRGSAPATWLVDVEGRTLIFFGVVELGRLTRCGHVRSLSGAVCVYFVHFIHTLVWVTLAYHTIISWGRYKELQGKLDLTREMRVVAGARPPQWQWKITKKSRVMVLEQVGDGGGVPVAPWCVVRRVASVVGDSGRKREEACILFVWYWRLATRYRSTWQ